MIESVSKLMRCLAGIMLVAMMLITCIDVGGNVFGYPLLGSEEMVSLLAALLIAFVLPSAHREKAHIGVDLLYLKLPDRLKKINNLFLCLCGMIFFCLVSWECVKYGLALKQIGQVSDVLELPTYYILYAVGFGCAVLSLAIAAEGFCILKGGIDE